MAHDVFISYATEDKTVADAVCATLESKGIRCWIAPRDVDFGEWAGSIMSAIAACRVVVLVFSSHANESSDVRREIQAALNRGVIVVPLRIQDVTPSPTFGYFLAPLHWLDAMTEPLQDHLNNLAERVQHILVPLQPNVLTADQSVKSSEARQAPNRRTLVTVVATVAAVVLIGVVVYYVVTPRSRNPPETVGPAEPRTLEFTEIAGGAHINRSPQYSPDGSRIAFQSNAPDGSVQIMTSGRDGANSIALTNFRGAYSGSPRWSHNGQLIVFDVRIPPAGQADIYVAPAGGGEPTQLTFDAADDVRPSFSNDDAWVYFGSNRTDRAFEIWKVPVGGGVQEQVTVGGGREALEAPDGDSILYTKFNTDGLWTARLHGKAQGTRVANLERARQGLWSVIQNRDAPTRVPATLVLVSPGDGPTRDLEFFSLPDFKKDPSRTIRLRVPDLAPNSGKRTEIRELSASPTLGEVAYAVAVSDDTRSSIVTAKLR